MMTLAKATATASTHGDWFRKTAKKITVIRFVITREFDTRRSISSQTKVLPI
jgi:hypothetical protein